MYADRITDSMKFAIDETNRRRTKQENYNTEHGIEPVSIFKAIHDLTDRLSVPAPGVAESRSGYSADGKKEFAPIPPNELKRIIHEMEKEMKQAAKDLEFEKAALLRDQIYDMRMLLAEQSDMPGWQKAKLLSGELN
jgi:excinuclease ABC subunit B